MLSVAVANAQTLKVTANVPFDFVLDKTTMPAGAYTIDSVLPSGSALAIRNRDAKVGRLVLADSARSHEASPDTRLVFHRYGDRYFLSAIWLQGERSGREFPTSKREAEVAKSLPQADNVIVLASLR
jgi:hypothetical protein